jgi:hypothetical protein
MMTSRIAKSWRLARQACFAAGLGGLLSLATPIQAEDRALLIGVGKYQLPGNNLPGIDLDIDMMQGTAALLGFGDNQIKVLQDEQATLANVERALGSWLVEGVSRGDRLLIYFSGHGTHIPDENGDELDDGADEVLVMHDVALTRRNGARTLTGVLVDDRFGELLAKMPSTNILVLVDACHSGTATKELQISPHVYGDTQAYVKSLSYAGMPRVMKGNFGVERVGTHAATADPDNYVVIAAARDDQESIATRQGSLFTHGVQEAVRKAAQRGQSITLEQVRADTQTFIHAKLGSHQAFNPQLSGNLELARKPLQLVTLNDGHGPVWRKMVGIVGQAIPLQVTLNRPIFGAGDALVITVDVLRTGYLNVVNVGPKDEPTVLFPNKYHDDNRVRAGRIVIPTERMDFNLQAQKPFGPSLVAALLTDRPINLYRSGDAQRNAKGEIIDIFSILSPRGVRSFAVVQKAREYLAAGMQETTVCATRTTCRYRPGS